MAKGRKSLALDVKKLVLHESGYRCANPTCQTILTLDIHHLEYVSEGGKDTSDNLLPLCPTCHALHHHGTIPSESLRAWKMLLISINEGLDRKSMDRLFALDGMDQVGLYVSGDGLFECGALLASRLISVVDVSISLGHKGSGHALYKIMLTERGKAIVCAWKRGDQQGVITPVSTA